MYEFAQLAFDLEAEVNNQAIVVQSVQKAINPGWYQDDGSYDR